MCSYGNTVAKLLPDFVQREEQRLNPVVDIDTCLEDVVDALWAAGVVTRSVCCGHGNCEPDIMVHQRDAAKAHEICAGRAAITYSMSDSEWFIVEYQRNEGWRVEVADRWVWMDKAALRIRAAFEAQRPAGTPAESMRFLLEVKPVTARFNG